MPRPTLRTLLAIASAIGGAAILQEFGVKYAVQMGWYDNLPQKVEVAMTWLATLTGPLWIKFSITFIIGLTLGLWLDAVLRPRRASTPIISPIADEFAPRSLIRLRFSGNLEAPELVDEENISNWFVYWTPSARMGDPESNTTFFEIPASWIIFLTFKNSVKYRQITTSFTGERPSMIQVRQAVERSAIVTIEGSMPACELEILTRG